MPLHLAFVGVGRSAHAPRHSTTSINLFHLRRLISCTLDLLKWGKVIVVSQTLIVIINTQAELDHAVDATRELCWLIEVEARCQQGGVEEEPDQVLHSLVRLVRC